ncbi:hypothetical protein [Nonomuraea dietziae]|uniref:hypothetical protein n=1 Tax=Nonomuraea dietziae TaxID=65515 RepID=UPI0031CFAE56
MPWSVEVLTDTAREVAVRLAVRTRRLPYRVEKTFRLARERPLWRSRAGHERGAGGAARDVGHHLAFGRPFLRPGARIRVPEGVRVIPHATSIDPRGRRGRGAVTVAAARLAERDRLPDRFDTGWYEVASQVGAARGVGR